MRLAGQAKLGFFAANPLAIEALLKHLVCRELDPNRKKSTINIIDPCCGKGAALHQLQQGLGVPAVTTFGVELDPERVTETRTTIPGIPKDNILGPASFLNVQISGSSFGMAYVNPPFDNEIGGGRREEQAFCQQATRLLVPKGVLILVCPYKALNGNSQFVEFIDSHYEDVAVYKFPDGVDKDGNLIRPYNEIAVFGKKRGTAFPKDSLSLHGALHKMDFKWGSSRDDIAKLPSLGSVQPLSWKNGNASYDRETELRVWEIPLAWAPHVFKKTMFTDAELAQVVAESPLNKLLGEVKVSPPQCPPLPLDKGHLGLILASGMLNGVVVGPHGNHVVRGSSQKVTYHNKEASTSTENSETGAVTTKDVYSQRMVTVIRVVEDDGIIKTFDNNAKKEEEDDDEA